MESSRRSGVRQYRKSELPRFRWTPELHEHFVEAIKRLGGKYRATPKRILQAMGVRGLRISHIKSHLQMYRNLKYENKLDALVDMEHLPKKEAQFSDDGIKILSTCSSPRPLREELMGPECKRWAQCPILVDASYGLRLAKADDDADDTEDSGTSFHDRMSNGEASNEEELHQISELSLSLFTATPSLTRREEQMSLPLTENRDHQIISSSCSTNTAIHIPECRTFGSNSINLDLTI